MTLADVAAKFRADYDHLKGPNRVRSDGVCVDENCFCGTIEAVMAAFEADRDFTLRDRVVAFELEMRQSGDAFHRGNVSRGWVAGRLHEMLKP
jgi:hypothetical protein